MVWAKTIHNRVCGGDPVELRLLKEQLANVNCSCDACERSKDDFVYHRTQEHIDQQVQTERREPSTQPTIMQETSAGSQQPINYNHYPMENIQTMQNHSAMCPSCLVMMGVLRNGVTKVVKDEQSEIKPHILLCDKYTEHLIQSVDRSTSATKHIVSNDTPSDGTVCEFISDSASSSILVTAPKRRGSPHQQKVTFMDVVDEPDSPAEQIPSLNCLCLDDFMKDIRPPLPALNDASFITETL